MSQRIPIYYLYFTIVGKKIRFWPTALEFTACLQPGGPAVPNPKGERTGVKGGYISSQGWFPSSSRVQWVLTRHHSCCWGTREDLLLPPPFFVWFKDSLLCCGLSFPWLISLERAQGFVFSAVWRYLGRRVFASSDIWICQRNSSPHPSESAEKMHRALSVGSSFHQSVKLLLSDSPVLISRSA